MAGLLVVTVLAAVGLIRVVRNQGGGDAVTVDPGQIDPQPASSVPLPTSTPEPPKPAPQPPENHPPNIEIVSVEPETPEAGGSLTVLLTGRDPEGDAIAFEYRTGPNSPWQIAADGRVALSGLQAGMLNLELRARDSVGQISEVRTLTKDIRAPAPPPVPPPTASAIRENTVAWFLAKAESELAGIQDADEKSTWTATLASVRATHKEYDAVWKSLESLVGAQKDEILRSLVAAMAADHEFDKSHETARKIADPNSAAYALQSIAKEQ
ncbi:MAG TPA: hypothetical protein VND64_11375, partial [Pirellulales bacterium]|nr:hypothetical protein [Pirellulales bacterium]